MRASATAATFPFVVDAILTAVERVTGTRRRDVLSCRRMQPAALHRQIAMWVARETTPASLPMIGRWFDRDHSTVHHAVHKIERLIREKPDVWSVATRVLIETQRLLVSQAGDDDPRQGKLTLGWV